MIITVTPNVAVDKTLTVPNFQVGFRHRASESLTLPGGKGINIARALKALGQPVVVTGLVGGRAGQLVVEGLQRENILNDFVHIGGESRTSTAVVDPTTMTQTEIIDKRGLLGFLGADARNRTEDPIITSDVLCQLSYVGSEEALGF